MPKTPSAFSRAALDTGNTVGEPSSRPFFAFFRWPRYLLFVFATFRSSPFPRRCLEKKYVQRATQSPQLFGFGRSHDGDRLHACHWTRKERKAAIRDCLGRRCGSIAPR